MPSPSSSSLPSSKSFYVVRLDVFASQNKDLWDECGLLIQKSKKNVDACKNLRDIYPILAGHYSFLKENYPDSEYCIRIKKYLYSSRSYLDVDVENSRKNIFFRVIHFYLKTLPYQIYQNRKLFLASTFIFWLAISISFIVTIQSPEFGSSFLGSSMSHSIRSQIESGLKFQNFFLPDGAGQIVFVQVLLNNIKVALLTTLSGLLLGIGTFYVLIKNAFLVGSLSGLYYKSPYFIDFMTQIFQHGFLELMAICFAGTCGLLIATPFFYSGHILKRDFFRKKLSQAVILFTGVLSLLFLAAIIEGFITTMHLEIYERYKIIGSTALLFFLYIAYSLSRFARKWQP